MIESIKGDVKRLLPGLEDAAASSPAADVVPIVEVVVTKEDENMVMRDSSASESEGVAVSATARSQRGLERKREVLTDSEDDDSDSSAA